MRSWWVVPLDSAPNRTRSLGVPVLDGRGNESVNKTACPLCARMRLRERVVSFYISVIDVRILATSPSS